MELAFGCDRLIWRGSKGRSWILIPWATTRGRTFSSSESGRSVNILSQTLKLVDISHTHTLSNRPEQGS
jgi:hypothetical protein